MSANVRLRVEHDTRYTYPARASLAYHLACLRPREMPVQLVAAYELMMEPTPTQHSTRVDAFGNRRDLFAFFSPHEILHVGMRCDVELAPRDFAQARVVAAPWEQVASALRYRAGEPWMPCVSFFCPSGSGSVTRRISFRAAKSTTATP